MFKLEIGSGSNPQPGYTHLDCRLGLPQLGIAADINTDLPFKEGCVDEILSHSSIEHISWRKIRETLTDWFRVLRPGGNVIIYTPDFRYLCEMYLKGQTDEHLDESYIEESKSIFGAYTPTVWAVIKMFAGQEYPENFHYASYDFELLKSLLESIGFTQITRIEPPYNLRVVAYKPKSVIRDFNQKPIQIEEFQLQPPAPKIQTQSHPPTQMERKHGLVHVNLIDKGWILERMGLELERHLDYVSVGEGPDPHAKINYHINYHAFKNKNAFDMALFTHIEEFDPAAKNLFFTAARNLDHCICMSKLYENILRESDITNVSTIMPGIELQKFKPILRIGVVGRTYHTGRKGENLVAQAMSIPHTQWFFVGSGWPPGGTVLPYERLPEFYQLIDCLLVPAQYEGGPMPVLEALAAGKPVIAPPVGFVPDFPHIEYTAGDADSLRARIETLVEERLTLRRSVEQRTWQRWAVEHHRLFRSFLPSDEMISLKFHQISDEPTSDPTPLSTHSITFTNNPQTSDTKSLKILLVGRREQLTGGPSIRIPILKRHLLEMGHQVSISYESDPDPSDFDVAHVFNVWTPGEAFIQMKHLKKYKVPLVLSPIFLDLTEFAWAENTIKLIFHKDVDQTARENYLQAMANGSLMLDKRLRSQGLEIFPNANKMLREIILLADHIITLSIEEMQRISKNLSLYNPNFTVVRNGTDFDAFKSATPDWFINTYGIKDFILNVGRLETRKNQVMLLHAMRNSNIPMVFIGQHSDEDYKKLCQAIAPRNTLFIPQLNRQELGSAYSAARVCAQPSWCEGASLVNLEAAAAGCSLVVSNRSSEFEYFGDSVRYCDPADWRSIGNAVSEAYQTRDSEKQKRDRLRNQLKSLCNWKSAASSTVAAYHRVINSFRRV